MQFDPMLVLPLVLIVVLGVLMWRGNKQRAKAQSELKAKIGLGADVMTQAGIFGTIVDIDEAANVTTIETTPGTRIRVHSMTIANVVTPVVPDDASSLSGEPNPGDDLAPTRDERAPELRPETADARDAAPVEGAAFDDGAHAAGLPAADAVADERPLADSSGDPLDDPRRDGEQR